MDVRLGELKKYVPFMDYLLETNFKHSDKFKKMRQWIVENKKFSKEYFQKIEKSIIVTYRDRCQQKDFPNDLHKIFTVDLCSDNESEEEAVKQMNGKSFTLSGNENEGKGKEVVPVATPTTTINKCNSKSTKKDSSQLEKICDVDLNPNAEILRRIYGTNAGVKTHREHTQDEKFVAHNLADNRIILKRCKSVEKINNESNKNFLNNIDSTATEMNGSRFEKTKTKKKKKKHKKEKRHRMRPDEKHNGQFKIVHVINIESSDDDSEKEKASSTANSTEESLDTYAAITTDIENLDESELMRMKNNIITAIETESKNDIKDKPKERSRTPEFDESNPFNESELLQMKDSLMKKIGLDEQINQILENLDVTDLPNGGTIESKKDENGNENQFVHTDYVVERPLTNTASVLKSAPIKRSETVKINSRGIEDAPMRSKSFYKAPQPIPVIDPSTTRRSLNNQKSLTNVFQKTSPTQSSCNLQLLPPCRPPVSRPNSQFISSIQNPSYSNGSFQVQSDPRLPVLQPVPQPLLQSVPWPVQPPLLQQVPQPVPPPVNGYPQHTAGMPMPLSQSVCYSSNAFPTQAIPTRCTSFNEPLLKPSTGHYPVHSSTLKQIYPPPRMSINTTSYAQGCSQNLTYSEQHKLLERNNMVPSMHPNSVQLNQPHGAVQINNNLNNPQALKDPRVRRFIEEGQYVHNQQNPMPTYLPSFQPKSTISSYPQNSQPVSTITSYSASSTPVSTISSYRPSSQPMSTISSYPTGSKQTSTVSTYLPSSQSVSTIPTHPPNSQPVTTIHNWIQQTDSSQVSQHPFQNSIPNQNQNSITYVDYVREMHQKRILDEERKRRKENEERVEKEKKLQEKKVEDIKLQRQKEIVGQILNNHKNREKIAVLLEGLNSPKQKKSEETISETDNGNTAKKVMSGRLSIENSKKEERTQKIVKRRKSCMHRDLKGLECTVKGFNTIQDFVMTNDGKRRSSVSARKAIASLMGPSYSDKDDENSRLTEILYEKQTTSPAVNNKKRRISSSVVADTEVFPKRQKPNSCDKREREAYSMGLIKPCRVILKRISSGKIAKLTKKPNPKLDKGNPPLSEKNNVASTTKRRKSSVTTAPSKKNVFTETALVKQTEVKKSYVRKSTKTPLVVKNIDSQMTERNCDKCVICNTRSTNLVNHFIRIHRCESYLSRLTWEELDDLQIRTPFAEELTANESENSQTAIKYKQFRVECPFCPEKRRKIKGTFPDLRRHYSTHTGEYAYQCKGCGLQKPYRHDIINHQKRTKCNDMGFQMMYQYQDSMVIYMHVCNICNFVQLNEENVFKHLREQHGKLHKDHKYVKEYILAVIKDGPIERVRLGTLPAIIASSQTDMKIDFFEQSENENVVVSNEPLSEDTFCDALKSESTIDEQEFLWEIVPGRSNSISHRSDSNSPSDISSTAAVDGNSMDAMNDQKIESMETTLIVDIKPEIDSTERSFCGIAESHGELGIQVQQPISEIKPDPEKLTVETVRALLRKYSSNTGIRPDLLYQCSKHDCGGYFSTFKLWSSHMVARHNAIISTCPHCVSKKRTGFDSELPLDDFEQHFKTHCLPLYLCFHCDTRCADEQQLREHAQNMHRSITEVRIESIPFNVTYSYHVLVGKDTLPARLDFLMQFCNVLRERIKRIEAQAEDSEHNNSQWSVPDSVSWLDDLRLPAYSTSISCRKCMLTNCGMSFPDSSSLLKHLNETHDDRKNFRFSCLLCGFFRRANTWESLVEHNFLHAESIFLCCVCSHATHSQRLLSNHVCAQHDKRDVPILHLERSKLESKVEISFIFASGSRTFTTTNLCFCGCGFNNLRIDTLVSHLKREHFLKLRYYCEYCDERLPELGLSDEHHRVKHSESGRPLKIRCQLACSNDRHIEIVSICPLEIRLSDENYENCQNVSDVPQKENSFPVVAIKKECDDDGEVVFMEDDDIIAEKEAKQASELSEQNLAPKDISCTSIMNLI